LIAAGTATSSRTGRYTEVLVKAAFLLTAVLAALGASSACAASSVTPPPLGQCASGAPPRQEVRALTDDQWSHYIAAIKQLQARSTPEAAAAYDRLAFLHHQYTNVVHNAAAFLPWHRLFLRTFEYELQQIDPSVAVPFWDWTQESQRLAAAPFWTGARLGGDGGRDGVVRTGRFAGWVPRYGRGGLRSSGPHGLLRDWRVPRNLGAGYAAPRIDAQLRRATTYDQFRQAIEGGSHNLVHALIGGDMNDTSFSPDDPVFWMHHAFIDELWARWQASAPGHATAYGGLRPDLHRATLDDRLPGFGDVRVRDVMSLSATCTTYDTAVAIQPTTTTLRTSAGAITPSQDVFYIATVSRAEGGSVDFASGGTVVCADVPLVFAVNTWTATCHTNAGRVRRGPGSARVVATFSGDRANAPSHGGVAQRVVARQLTVLWGPPEHVVYGAPLGDRLRAFADRPGQQDVATLPADGTPPQPVTERTILPAGFHVLTLRYTPDSGPSQLLTRKFVVERAPIHVVPRGERVSTEDPTPPLTYTLDGLAAGENPAVLAGFLAPVCRAERPPGSAVDDPRPEGDYAIACEGGDAPNYTIDTSATATLEVLEPGDPRLDEPVPPLALGGAPHYPRRHRRVCSTFRRRLFCGVKAVPGRTTVEIRRHGRLVATGAARQRGSLLALRLHPRVSPGRYRLVLTSGERVRRVLIRVIPPAQAHRASAPAPTLLCRPGTTAVLLGTHTLGGRRVTRWRVSQAPR
jgi:hypothetical protein